MLLRINPNIFDLFLLGVSSPANMAVILVLAFYFCFLPPPKYKRTKTKRIMFSASPTLKCARLVSMEMLYGPFEIDVSGKQCACFDSIKLHLALTLHTKSDAFNNNHTHSISGQIILPVCRFEYFSCSFYFLSFNVIKLIFVLSLFWIFNL